MSVKCFEFISKKNELKNKENKLKYPAPSAPIPLHFLIARAVSDPYEILQLRCNHLRGCFCCCCCFDASRWSWLRLGGGKGRTRCLQWRGDFNKKSEAVQTKRTIFIQRKLTCKNFPILWKESFWFQQGSHLNLLRSAKHSATPPRGHQNRSPNPLCPSVRPLTKKIDER